MTESVKSGKILDLSSEPTLSDGTAGGIESEAITFELCRQLIDRFIVVSEEEIAAAMRDFIDSHHMLLEGAAGVAIAGLLANKARYAQKNVVVVVCGGNISRETLKQVL
jgi:threonine dehydratase